MKLNKKDKDSIIKVLKELNIKNFNNDNIEFVPYKEEKKYIFHYGDDENVYIRLILHEDTLAKLDITHYINDGESYYHVNFRWKNYLDVKKYILAFDIITTTIVSNRFQENEMIENIHKDIIPMIERDTQIDTLFES